MVNRDKESYEQETGTEHNRIKNISYLTVTRILKNCKRDFDRNHNRFGIRNIYGIPRGGLIPAVMLSNYLAMPLITDENMIGPCTLIVDDLVETGKTLKSYPDNTKFVLYSKKLKSEIPSHIIVGRYCPKDTWIRFFWEPEE